jgi:ribonuclease Z
MHSFAAAPMFAPTETALCYIVQPKKKEGTLLLDKCIAKGVPPGPLLGKLKSGIDVTLPDGTVVLSDDVRSPDCPGPIFVGNYSNTNITTHDN